MNFPRLRSFRRLRAAYVRIVGGLEGADASCYLLIRGRESGTMPLSEFDSGINGNPTPLFRVGPKDLGKFLYNGSRR
jgi:hypothetical protein